MVELDFCAWLCPACCEKYGWVEEREIPKGEKVFCENCMQQWCSNGRLLEMRGETK